MASADYSVGTKVTADVSNFEKGMNKAEKSLKGFSDKLANSIDRLGKNGLIGSMANVTLAVGGLTKSFNTVIKFAKDVGKAINDCTEAYKVQIIAERALDTAIQNNPFVTGESSKALKEFASEMQRVSNYGDEELIPMMTNLISLGRTEAETMQIMSVAMDMSAGMGISLDTAITQLNATLNGNIGRLGQQNAELKGLTEEELKQGKAIEILGNKFKGLSSATADTSKQLKNIKGDFKEALGEFTLPSSDMWNRFWSGFYTKGIEIIKQFNDYLDASIIGKTIYKQLSSNADVVAQSQGITKEDVLSDFGYLEEQLSYLNDEELRIYKNYLSNLHNRTQGEERMLAMAQELINLKKQQAEQDKKEAEAKAEEVKRTKEQAETEDVILNLKNKHLEKIKEQEAKWENIKKVTGEEIKLEEKLKFYQDDLVAIMTESGGYITENNQYFKDQKKIIDELIKAIQEAGGEVAETETEIVELAEEGTSELKKFFNSLKEQSTDWQSTFSSIFQTVQQSYEDMFVQLGKSLVEGNSGWQNYASIAVGAIAEVISALGKQLTVMAAAKAVTRDYAGAAKAVAGAAVAFTSSGVLTAVASKLDSTQKSIKSIGDTANQSGKDLEYFKKRLEEIISGQTISSRNLLGNLTTLSGELKVLKERANEALKAVEAFPQNKKYIATSASTYRETKAWKEVQENYESVRKEVEKYENTISSAIPNIINTLNQEVSANNVLKKSYDEIYNSYWKYQSAYSTYMNTSSFYVLKKQSAKLIMQSYEQEIQLLIAEQKESLQKMFVDVYESLSNTGKTIGEKLINSIVNGAEKTDFLKDMKSYIRENLIKLVVYTETFQDKLAEVGMTLARALTEGVSVYGVIDLSKVKKELEDLYETASTNAKAVESILDGVFGNLDKNIEEATDNISDALDEVEDKLSTFEEAMQSFNETISDLGGNLADNLIDGISDGLDEGKFLDNMKNWIRKMLIQSAVYTESMKAEFEAIGQSITKGIREGFTETSLHEIRRDLSWVFNEANETVASLDDILDRTFSGYATGTNNAMSGLHLVGEAGPELVKFRGGEQVLNANNTQKALEGMSGTTINQNVTFNNLQDTTAYAMMNQFKQYNRSLAINGVI